MDAIATAKSYARILRDRPYFNVELSQGHALELVTSLISRASSWNEFATGKQAVQLPESVSDYFGAVGRAQRRILTLGICPHWVRGLRSTAAVHFLDCLNCARASAQSLWEIMDRTGVRPIHTLVASEGRSATLEDSREFLVPRVSNWFFGQLSPDLKYGEYPWDHTAELARANGFTEREAAMIRQLQREAPNHSWDLDLWFEVGVLDPDQREFLNELKQQKGWFESFGELYATDGYRGEIDPDTGEWIENPGDSLEVIPKTGE